MLASVFVVLVGLVVAPVYVNPRERAKGKKSIIWLSEGTLAPSNYSMQCTHARAPT